MRILLTNALFALIVWGYYWFVSGNKPLFVQGVVLAFIAYCCGIVVGAGVSQKQPNRRRSALPVSAELFDRIA